MPHILPCPAQHRVYADGAMPPNEKRKHRAQPTGEEAGPPLPEDVLEDSIPEGLDAESLRRKCPVPKPRGQIGELLGFVERDAPGKSDSSNEPPSHSQIDHDERDRRGRGST